MPSPIQSPAPSSAPNLSDAVLTIDLSAIAANYHTLCKATPSAQVAAAVKADAYGTGLFHVAPALAKAGVTTFFVAQLQEGIALRNRFKDLDISAQIYVFDGLRVGQAEALTAHALTPVLNTLDQIDQWAAFGRASSALPAALHIDTGMNRLGLDEAGVDALASDPERLKGIVPKLIMSHLACADTPDHPLNKRQLVRFKKALPRLPQAPASLANSAGIYLGPDYHFDMVRPGIALYGGNPTPEYPNPMQAVAALNAPILQIRSLSAGDTVGYGATFTAARPSRIAILPVGYADGFLRSLSGTGHLIIQGQRLPLVGRVSMDLIAVDVTDIPEGQISEGDQVTIFGNAPDMDTLANEAGSISYELLTGLGHRYKRRYVD